jgi:Coenzyme PQQ synthesis protein D (PqqD)
MATAIPGEILEHCLFSDRFRPRAHVIWAGQADATVLLDGERGRYYTLNQVAGRTWDLLVAGEPLIEILNCLAEEYDVAAETLQADVAATLSLLLDAALIERLPP